MNGGVSHHQKGEKHGVELEQWVNDVYISLINHRKKKKKGFNPPK